MRRRLFFAFLAVLGLLSPASAQQIVSPVRTFTCTNEFPRSLSNSAIWNCDPVNLASDVTGNLGVSHLNSGTSASSSTFWRGDATWATPSGSSTNGSNNDILTSDGSGAFGTAITPAAGGATFLATPSSANLRAFLTDEVGTGAAYFVGGALGTPASGTATNLTSIPVANATGVLPAANGGAGTVSGALKANGSGTVSQAACADLSDDGTACTATTGTSGATLGLLNANKTDSGTNTFTGTNTFSAVQGNAGNTGGLVTGTTYTFAATDCGSVVVFTSGSAVTATIPSSIVPTFPVICSFGVLQSGAGKVSVNGSAVAAATLVSDNSYTATSGTAGNQIGLLLINVSGTAKAFLSGAGS